MSDYVSMWEDLGMDLENHDLLCQVLPTAVGDQPGKSPKSNGFLGFSHL